MHATACQDGRMSLLAEIGRDFLRVRQDRRPGLWWVLIEAICSPGFRAVFYYRLAHHLFCRNIPALPALLSVHCIRSTGADISPAAKIGPGLLLPHPVGIVIGNGCLIGQDCQILQHVTCGESLRSDGDHSYPEIGERVILCAGALCLGGVKVGADSIVGANSVVTRSVPNGVVVAGAPARVLRPVKPAGEPSTEPNGRTIASRV